MADFVENAAIDCSMNGIGTQCDSLHMHRTSQQALDVHGAGQLRHAVWNSSSAALAKPLAASNLTCKTKAST